MIEPIDPSRPIFRSHAYIGSTAECFEAILNPKISWALIQRTDDAGQRLSDALKPLTKTDRFVRHAIEEGPIKFPLYRPNDVPSTRTLSTFLSQRMPGLEIIADPLSTLFADYGRHVIQERRRAIKSEVRLQIGAAGDLLFHTDKKPSEGEVRLIMSFHGPGVECLDFADAVYGPPDMARARSKDSIYRTRPGDPSLMKNTLLHRTPEGCDPDTNARIVVVMDPGKTKPDEKPKPTFIGWVRQKVNWGIGLGGA